MKGRLKKLSKFELRKLSKRLLARLIELEDRVKELEAKALPDAIGFELPNIPRQYGQRIGGTQYYA